MKTTLGGPHRHRHHLFCICFNVFCVLDINNLDAFQGSSIEAPSLSSMLSAKAYKNHMELQVLLPHVLLRGKRQYWNHWNHTRIYSLCSIMYFHMSSCKSEARCRPPTCDFQRLSVAYKTIATSQETTLGWPHQHRHHSFCASFMQCSAFFAINTLDAFQGGSTEAPRLSFMSCAKAYRNIMKLIFLFPIVFVRGMRNIEILEIT